MVWLQCSSLVLSLPESLSFICCGLLFLMSMCKFLFTVEILLETAIC